MEMVINKEIPIRLVVLLIYWLQISDFDLPGFVASDSAGDQCLIDIAMFDLTDCL